MKTILFFLMALTVAAETPKDLSQHVFFKHFLGEWKAAGELKGEDGKVIPITETWKGSAAGDSAFVTEGKRTLNNETKSFKWTFTHNPATDTFDAVLEGEPGDQPLRFEAMISDVNLTLELKAITGTNSAITVKDEFTDEKHETISSDVTFTGESGQTTLEGTITHTKVNQP